MWWKRTRKNNSFDTVREFIDRLTDVQTRLVNIENKLNFVLRQDASDLYKSANDLIGSEDQLYGCITFSQSADDIISICILEMIGVDKPSYLDIGAHHPIKISNTALMYQRGSRGVNIEANPALIEPFYKYRPEDINLNVGVSDQSGRMTFYRFDEQSGLNTFNPERRRYVEEELGIPLKDQIVVEVTTVSDIVDKHCGGVFPDFLSLDVEGLDFRILNSIPYEKYGPKLINVEANHAEDVTNIVSLLTRKGYRPHFRMRGNLFFLKAEYGSANIPV